LSANSYKLLVIDIDGTLVGEKGRISPEDKDALRRVSDAGIRVSLSTGRSLQSCLGIIDELSLDGHHITFDGALVSDQTGSKEVYVKPLRPEVVRQAVEFAHANDIAIDFYSATQYFIERETRASEIQRNYYGIKPIATDFSDLWQKERIIKGGMVTTSPQEVAKARDFHDKFSNQLHFSWVKTPAYPDVDFINVVARGVSKAEALPALVSHLGIEISEVVAVGDGTNDLSILNLAELAVAMGNAPPEVKDVADYVTLDVDQSGLAAAIHKFLL
jgi:Cof subfamily protein (haloacid dehalogenase superfamily)